MFVLSQQGHVTFRAIAMLVSVALVLWAVGAHMTAEAANLTNVSNTLSDSDPSALSDHVIQFTIPVGSDGINAGGEQIVVTFPNNFDFTADAQGTVDESDVDLNIATSDQTIVAGLAPAINQWGFDLTGQVLTLQSGGGTAVAAATEVVIITVGEAAAGGAANSQVTNPVATGSSEFLIDVASGQDTGRTQVTVIENVDVTARVDTNFEFTIAGFAVAGTDANGTTTTGTSSATEIPFGTLSAGVVETIAQRLNVTTNASFGYTVTVEQDQNLLSTVGDIDGFADGAYTNTPSDWAAPNGTLGFGEDGWGHWGLTSTDDLNAGEFQGCGGAATGCWVAASTTPRDVMHHNGPSDGTTDDVGSTTVAYQVEITPLQQAADDYSTTLTYIATPEF